MKRFPDAILIAAVIAVVSATGSLAQMPAADIENGEASSRKCHACHDFTEGGPNKIGPPMFGIVGTPAASVPGYSYSQVLMDMRDTGLVWTPETLAPFLTDPRAFAPGNKMSFAGIRDRAELNDVIAYLASISPGYVPEPPRLLTSPTDRGR